MSLIRFPRIAPVIPAFFLLVVACPDPSFAASQPNATKSSPTQAKETALQRIQRAVARINAEAATPAGEEAVVARLSRQLGIPPDALRQQQRDWGLGYGEVAMAHGFARAAKKPTTAAQVVELRRSGKNWEAIGKELGVKLDAVAARMKRSVAPKAKT